MFRVGYLHHASYAPYPYCYWGDWIDYHGRYAWVARRHHSTGHTYNHGGRVRPSPPDHRHPPPAHWVRVSGQRGVVPRHPDDIPGKPPVNLRHGVLVPPRGGIGPVERVQFPPSDRIKVLAHAPREYTPGGPQHANRTEAPLIDGRLMRDPRSAFRGAAPAVGDRDTSGRRASHAAQSQPSNDSRRTHSTANGGFDRRGDIADPRYGGDTNRGSTGTFGQSGSTADRSHSRSDDSHRGGGMPPADRGSYSAGYSGGSSRSGGGSSSGGSSHSGGGSSYGCSSHSGGSSSSGGSSHSSGDSSSGGSFHGGGSSSGGGSSPSPPPSSSSSSGSSSSGASSSHGQSPARSN